MTAGGGIMHEEMPRPQEGKMAGFQLWVNLPAKLKMMQPRYQDIAAAQIPTYKCQDGVNVRVIAGEMDGVQGPVTGIAADPTYLDVTVPAGAVYRHPIPRGHTVFAYPFEGRASFGRKLVSSPNLIVFGDGDLVEVRTAQQGVRFLLVSGRPLGEPISRYGPFVMNTREEIEQALRDLRNGTFIWQPPE
jgi:redox-sensitive bicupin YhaK (pirin superfamily)